MQHDQICKSLMQTEREREPHFEQITERLKLSNHCFIPLSFQDQSIIDHPGFGLSNFACLLEVSKLRLHLHSLGNTYRDRCF